MKVATFGLGYVGSVSAGCLASAGHEIVGVDLDPLRLSLIRQGRSPVTEPGLDKVLAAALGQGRLRLTEETADAVAEAAVSLICVGTPGRRNGSLQSPWAGPQPLATVENASPRRGTAGE